MDLDSNSTIELIPLSSHQIWCNPGLTVFATMLSVINLQGQHPVPHGAPERQCHTGSS